MSEMAGPPKDLQIVLEEARTPTGFSNIPTVDKISTVHRQVVMAGEAGFTNIEIAGMLGLEPNYVGQIRGWKHPVLDAARQEAKDRISGSIVDLTARIKFHAEEALDRMVGHMRSQDLNTSRLAAKDIMDRAGYAPVKKVAEVSTQVPSEEFMSAVARMEKSDEVVRMREEFGFRQPPVATVPAPKTGTNG